MYIHLGVGCYMWVQWDLSVWVLCIRWGLHVHSHRHGVISIWSQGVLERFHQTFKSMLRAYCHELGRCWEEGAPWLLLASKEVVPSLCSVTFHMGLRRG